MLLYKTKINILHYVEKKIHNFLTFLVWRHRGECTLVACIRYHHTFPSSCVMIWVAIGYTSRSLLVRIDLTLSGACYISSVLEPVVFTLFERGKTLSFTKIIPDRLLTMYKDSVIWKIFDGYPGLYVLLISRW